MIEDNFFFLVYLIGFAAGLWSGWCLWRRPQLKYKTGEQNERQRATRTRSEGTGLD